MPELYQDLFDCRVNKESMLYSFRTERVKIQRIQSYFDQNFRSEIHAVGFVAMENPNEHLEFNEPPFYAVMIGWRSMYYRKIIPRQLDDGYGEIDRIIENHIP